MITVERTDFVSVPVTDRERSKRFYGETLGLPLVSGGDAWPEYQLGENVSLYLIDPTNIGQAFTGAALLAHRAAGAGRGGGARGARERRRRVRGRDLRHRRLPHGLLPRSRRERADAAPELCAGMRAELLERYQAIPLPTKSDEHWRFTDLAGFDPD